MTDQLQRFIFDNTDIRGEITRLDKSYQDTLANHNYPEVVAHLLGEFMAAATLLSATLKFEGTLTLQVRSEGEIPLIMAEASSDHKLRAIAREADAASSKEFTQLLANGQLIITVDPKKGQRYQGIVVLEGNNLSECLEAYFLQSEQLSTRVWLASNNQQAVGMMLQELPPSDAIEPAQRQQQWQHVTKLAETLTAEELLSLPFDELLYRLYHQEQVRLFEADTLAFQCSCSETRTLNALRTLGREELDSIIEETGAIDINCEFCHQHYRFDSAAVASLFEQTLH
ncbi:MAG: Hsp33 family molecular chaperone HslO [Oceanicoccus sp.]|uniref:Hsp33 family molecular chaperone HslO n=1 Tax=Oceanicoccus sp. TaxID=2691044 RepID=UPI0026097F62|nr:Hsp33 family molecular chaperone HslO [Oceanicoccus sp.]MCP3907576.1 Hsp33 family molecular chaperone HslO [Oceanicoccus sp.]MDG1772388.1 Hsp33 family molecular chaperone HslO [Oceanicoccus sp.]